MKALPAQDLNRGEKMKITNPIGITNIGDPFVLNHEGKYYLYATSFIDGFYCWVSDDLVNWSVPIKAYKLSNRSFGYADFWAPEVVYHNNQFIMHYSARQKNTNSLKIGVAVSESPLGPFIDVYDNKPMFDFGFAAIDGHVFMDDNNKNYFYFDRDCSEYIYENRNESHIYVCELDHSLTKIISDIKLVLKPSQDWEMVTGDWRWNEGAFMLKHNKMYYLMYSAGFYASKSYGIGYAVSDSPYGPFKKARENPILKTNDKVSGPGHNSVVSGLNGKFYAVYHAHTDYENPSPNRQVYIDELYFDNDKLVIKGPTHGDKNETTI